VVRGTPSGALIEKREMFHQANNKERSSKKGKDSQKRGRAHEPEEWLQGQTGIYWSQKISKQQEK